MKSGGYVSELLQEEKDLTFRLRSILLLKLYSQCASLLGSKLVQKGEPIVPHIGEERYPVFCQEVCKKVRRIEFAEDSHH